MRVGDRHLDGAFAGAGAEQAAIHERIKGAVDLIGIAVVAQEPIEARGEVRKGVIGREQARHAASLVRPEYDVAPGRFDLAAGKDGARAPKDLPYAQTDTGKGDFDAAYAAAPRQLDVMYTTPFQFHAAMEPHATMASWKGDELTVQTSNQMPTPGRKVLAATFGLEPEFSNPEYAQMDTGTTKLGFAAYSLGELTIEQVDEKESTGKLEGPKISEVHSGTEVKTQL